ncbi:uncharacterized protein LOC134336259 isoform X2 [Trichomycterus rosablanca]|uniref:uncharacterized protein LOC134336259 isoform X2 n=1 Tax=Trichomycterus rosablanca TaxID=2290929 RepID=UPI002F35038F
MRETFLHLNIEVPVSSVNVTANCLSIPQRKVFCTAEGDELQYWWIVESMVPHELDKENPTLWVDKDSTGSFTCHVKNHVSTENKTFNLQPCPGSLYQDPAVCKFSPDDQHVPCYAALGRRLHLDPPQNLPRNFQFTLMKINKPSDQIILDYKTYSKKLTVIVQGWQFNINNYTIIINHTEKSDSATYRLEITDNNGMTRETSIHLNIEAPVSSVTVTENCLSIPQRKVFCTADGDELQYWWTVELSFPHGLDKENQTLLLDKNSTGSFTCHVKNHISSETRTFNLQPCPTAFSVFVTVWIFQIIVLLSFNVL